MQFLVYYVLYTEITHQKVILYTILPCLGVTWLESSTYTLFLSSTSAGKADTRRTQTMSFAAVPEELLLFIMDTASTIGGVKTAWAMRQVCKQWRRVFGSIVHVGGPPFVPIRHDTPSYDEVLSVYLNTGGVGVLDLCSLGPMRAADAVCILRTVCAATTEPLLLSEVPASHPSPTAIMSSGTYTPAPITLGVTTLFLPPIIADVDDIEVDAMCEEIASIERLSASGLQEGHRRENALSPMQLIAGPKFLTHLKLTDIPCATLEDREAITAAFRVLASRGGLQSLDVHTTVSTPESGPLRVLSCVQDVVRVDRLSFSISKCDTYNRRLEELSSLDNFVIGRVSAFLEGSASAHRGWYVGTLSILGTLRQAGVIEVYIMGNSLPGRVGDMPDIFPRPFSAPKRFCIRATTPLGPLFERNMSDVTRQFFGRAPEFAYSFRGLHPYWAHDQRYLTTASKNGDLHLGPNNQTRALATKQLSETALAVRGALSIRPGSTTDLAYVNLSPWFYPDGEDVIRSIPEAWRTAQRKVVGAEERGWKTLHLPLCVCGTDALAAGIADLRGMYELTLPGSGLFMSPKLRLTGTGTQVINVTDIRATIGACARVIFNHVEELFNTCALLGHLRIMRWDVPNVCHVMLQHLLARASPRFTLTIDSGLLSEEEGVWPADGSPVVFFNYVWTKRARGGATAAHVLETAATLGPVEIIQMHVDGDLCTVLPPAFILNRKSGAGITRQLTGVLRAVHVTATEPIQPENERSMRKIVETLCGAGITVTFRQTAHCPFLA